VGRPNELNRTVKGQWPPFTVAGFVRAASPAARRQAGRLLSYLIARLRPGMTRDA
jgi:hypothetical protein